MVGFTLKVHHMYCLGSRFTVAVKLIADRYKFFWLNVNRADSLFIKHQLRPLWQRMAAYILMPSLTKSSFCVCADVPRVRVRSRKNNDLQPKEAGSCQLVGI